MTGRVLRSHNSKLPTNSGLYSSLKVSPPCHPKHSNENKFISSAIQKKSAKKKATKKKSELKKTIPNKQNVISSCDSDSCDDLPSFKVHKKPLTKKQRLLLDKNRIMKPTWKEYLAEIKELAEYKKKVAKARQLLAEDDGLEEVNNWPTFSTDDEQSKQPKQSTLDCKHLSLEDIKKCFYIYSSTLHDIMVGKQYSSRHIQYEKRCSQRSEFSLTVSFSMIVFTFDQLHEMANLMNQTFDPENQKDEYFFKVLIPELCLLIFMDSHGMNKKQATEYLENRPVD